jgi:hypothetical protein
MMYWLRPKQNHAEKEQKNAKRVILTSEWLGHDAFIFKAILINEYAPCVRLQPSISSEDDLCVHASLKDMQLLRTPVAVHA